MNNTPQNTAMWISVSQQNQESNNTEWTANDSVSVIIIIIVIAIITYKI